VLGGLLLFSGRAVVGERCVADGQVVLGREA